MAMKHAHNVAKCTSCQCYSPQRSSLGYIIHCSIGNRIRAFLTWTRTGSSNISSFPALSSWPCKELFYSFRI